MPSMGMQLLGCILVLFGWIGVISVCALPTWRVTAFIGTNIVTSQTFWEGIWMSCVVESTGQKQCKVYDSMLALSPDLKAARILLVFSILVGIAGILVALVSGKCTNFIAEESGKVKASIVSGVLLMVSGVLCLITVSWTAIIIVNDFYNPLLQGAGGFAVPRLGSRAALQFLPTKREPLSICHLQSCKDVKAIKWGRRSSETHGASITLFNI